jgi:ABC-type Fe3+-hydroxamate transport system substrate-binding protein
MAARLIASLSASVLIALSACNSTGTDNSPAVGTIHVTAATTGTQLDDNGYAVSLDGGATQLLGLNASLDLMSVAAGSRDVLVTDIAPTCGPTTANPQRVTVSPGGTVAASFAFICGPPGTLTVKTKTQFLHGRPPKANRLLIDNVAMGTLAADSTAVYGGLRLGLHTVAMTFASGCVSGDLAATEFTTVIVQPAQDVTVLFSVVCFR